MKKWTAVLAALCLLFAFTGALAESNEGEVRVITPVDEEMTEAISIAPYVPENLDKAVIGSDDRITINNPSQYPYSAIAYMEAEGHCGCEWTGSAFMVSPSWLMTAGHCLYCTDHNEWAKTIDFYFGYKSRKNCYYRYEGRWTAWVSNAVVSGGNYSQDDYGYVKLEKRVGDKTGWFGMRMLSDSEISYSWYNVVGYRHGVIKRDYGMATVKNSKQIDHNADTEGGYSGCPIFDDDYYAVAINTSHYIDESANIGRRITSALLSEMRSEGYEH